MTSHVTCMHAPHKHGDRGRVCPAHHKGSRDKTEKKQGPTAEPPRDKPTALSRQLVRVLNAQKLVCSGRHVLLHCHDHSADSVNVP